MTFPLFHRPSLISPCFSSGRVQVSAGTDGAEARPGLDDPRGPGRAVPNGT